MSLVCTSPTTGGRRMPMSVHIGWRCQRLVSYFNQLIDGGLRWLYSLVSLWSACTVINWWKEGSCECTNWCRCSWLVPSSAGGRRDLVSVLIGDAVFWLEHHLQLVEGGLLWVYFLVSLPVIGSSLSTSTDRRWVPLSVLIGVAVVDLYINCLYINCN